MLRTVQPELLDTLPFDHPAARANRRDLRLINAIMGNHRWLRGQLLAALEPNDTILELGAGEGDLALPLRALLPSYHGLDRWPRPAQWPSGWFWHQADLLAFTHYTAFPLVVGNLIFHQFTASELARLGQRLSSARVILACEPVRRRLHQHQLKLLRPFGFSYVSRHDANVSIAAGFLRNELPEFPGLSPVRWDIPPQPPFLSPNRMAPPPP